MGNHGLLVFTKCSALLGGFPTTHKQLSRTAPHAKLAAPSLVACTEAASRETSSTMSEEPGHRACTARNIDIRVKPPGQTSWSRVVGSRICPHFCDTLGNLPLGMGVRFVLSPFCRITEADFHFPQPCLGEPKAATEPPASK